MVRREMVNKTIGVDDVLADLTIDEKVTLISGTDFWHTAAVHRLGVPAIRVSDGPNGVRGTKFFNGVQAACFPCGTALGATWDMDLIQKGGALMADEAIAKSASAILGPTVNMHRSPLGGRGFESLSEDPHLAGSIGAATVNGIQSKGVAAVIKHFVCNDQEHERMACDSVVSERAFREIYLKPFQIVEKDAHPMSYMTSYNRLNGLHCSENPRLLQGILRDEWGFDGMVMSDWFGTYSISESIKAGLDLEMPGPSYIRGKLIAAQLACHKIFTKDIDDRVREVLKFVKKVMPLGLPENGPEKTNDTAETSELLRNVGASSLVLMKNENNVLPLKKDKSVGVIGANAKFAAFCGGGSAALRPYYVITPFDGIAAKTKDVKYRLGAIGYKSLPLLSSMTAVKDGRKGMMMKVFLEPPSTPNREPVDEFFADNSEMMLVEYKHPKVPSNLWYGDITGTLTPEESGDYLFGISVAGSAKLYIDGNMIVDNETKQTPGASFFGTGTVEEIGSAKLEAGKSYEVLIQFGSLPTSKLPRPAMAFGPGGVRIGGFQKTDPQTEIEKAVELAKQVDQVVICTGLNGEWESEGYDRPNMDLPPNADALISAVAAANPCTVVVLQSGTPVAMPWLSSVPAIVQAWYGGNETGNAIADVLFGDVNPSGKLPLTFPVRVEDNPAFLNFKSERTRVIYGEDVYIGYRFYEKTKKEVAFPFGHGLSYTKFGMKDLKVSDKGDDINVSVTVTNEGEVDGAQVVQVYVKQQSPSLERPPKELKGFTKVFLKAGESKTAEVSISKKYAASFWDAQRDAWAMEKDKYEVLVGDSSASTPLKGEYFEVQKTKYWKGL